MVRRGARRAAPVADSADWLMVPAQRVVGELGRLLHLRRIGDCVAVYGTRPASSKADADMRPDP